jgi:surface antigen
MLALALGVLSLCTAAAMPGDRWIYPDVFGNQSVAACSGAPACGTVMSTYNDVAAYSNGQYQCTGDSCAGYGTYGYRYQCVELAQRYFATKYGTPSVWYANAKDMCTTHPSSVSKTSNPKGGDAVVFGWGTYGHVAIVTAVHDTTVDVIEQNSSPNGRNTYAKSDVLCYLTAGGGSGGSCPGSGLYCGGDGLGKDANDLFYCSGSGATATLNTDCQFTCVTMPSGTADKCSNSGSCSGLANGDYCGNDHIGGDANTLYHCSNGSPAGAVYCSNGCSVQPQGTNDKCK